MKRFVMVAVVAFGLSCPALAGYREAVTAYRKGDYTTAIREFEALAARGDANAQVRVADMYVNAEGAAQDYARALVWLRKAVAQGYARARLRLAHMYARAYGVPRDSVRAHVLLALAAEQGPGFETTSVTAFRGFLESVMSDAELAEARRRARAWLTAHGAACATARWVGEPCSWEGD